jgi:hypothetical protein
VTADVERRPGVDGVCGIPGSEHAPDTRLYPCGWRCTLHSPNALVDRPEPPPGPGWPIHRQPSPGTDPEAADPTGGQHHQDKDTS